MVYTADVALNTNAFPGVALSAAQAVATVAQTAMAHEFGHVLGLKDLPWAGNFVCSTKGRWGIPTVMLQDLVWDAQCGAWLPISPCDPSSVLLVYPSPVPAACPSGRCDLNHPCS